MKKKIIIVSIFLALIVITSVWFITAAIDSYNYEMDPANGVDILEGFEAGMLTVLGGFVVFYEFDLFYTVYYFFIRPKTLIKSMFVILSNLTLLLVFFSDTIDDFIARFVESPYEDGIIPIGLFLIYFILKMILLTICVYTEKE